MQSNRSCLRRSSGCELWRPGASWEAVLAESFSPGSGGRVSSTNWPSLLMSESTARPSLNAASRSSKKGLGQGMLNQVKLA